MRRELESIEVPGETAARARAWNVMSAAFADRQPVERASRRSRVALAAAVVAAALAAVLSSPGRAVLDEIRETVGVERAQPALFSLPSPGQLLVTSDAGLWVVQENGSKRLLGPYREASWSPFGRFVVAARENELAALEPDGDVRWTLARPGVRFPRWSGTETDTRIAYVDRTGIRAVAGDGTGDRLLVPRARARIAWRPGSGFLLAYATSREVGVFDAATGRTISRYTRREDERVTSLSWSSDGRWLILTTPARVVLHSAEAVPLNVRRLARATASAFAPRDHHLAVLRGGELLLFNPNRLQSRPARRVVGLGPLDGVAWSPNGRWLLVSWPTADQWIFMRADGTRIRAISNVSEQFHSRSFPLLQGWCCVP